MKIKHENTTTSRQAPEDLRMYRFRHGYVVTACPDRACAESAAQALVDTGFEREELVLVSRDVHALDVGWPGEDTLEVADPASRVRGTIGVAACATGGAAGALGGVMAAYFAGIGSGGTWSWALVGAVLGVMLGVLLGRLGHRLFGRRPARYYDLQMSGGQVLVGIGLARRRDGATRARARKALEGIGRSVVDLPR